LLKDSGNCLIDVIILDVFFIIYHYTIYSIYY